MNQLHKCFSGSLLTYKTTLTCSHMTHTDAMKMPENESVNKSKYIFFGELIQKI